MGLKSLFCPKLCFFTNLFHKTIAYVCQNMLYFMTKRNLSKYNDILICESCLFTDKEMSKINRLLEKGIRINMEAFSKCIEDIFLEI